MRPYGSLIDNLQASFTRNQNKYPHNLEKAIDMLDSQKLDTYIKSNKTALEKSTSPSSSMPESKSADNKKKSESNFTQNKSKPFKCHCYGSPDQTPSNCPLKDKVSHSEWFKETGRKPTTSNSHTQTKDDNDDSVGLSKCKSNSRSLRDYSKKKCTMVKLVLT